MSNSPYRIVFPSSQRTQYLASENIDFKLDFPNQALKPGSIRIEGKINVKKGANRNPDDSYIDCKAGIHGFFSSWTSSCENYGTVENLKNYPRYVAMKTVSKMDSISRSCRSDSLCELKAHEDSITGPLLRCPTGAADEGLSFSFKPDIALNKAQPMNYSKFGRLHLQTTLSTVQDVLYGRAAGDVDNTFTFNLSELQLTYEVLDEQPAGETMLEFVTNVEQTISSNNQQLSMKVDGVYNSVACSFVRRDRRHSYDYNSVALARLPGLTNLEWRFRDANQYYTIPMDNQEEWELNGMLALGARDVPADMPIWKLNNGTDDGLIKEDNQRFIVGLPFSRNLNLSNQTFGLNIRSNVGANPYVALLYFRGSKAY